MECLSKICWRQNLGLWTSHLIKSAIRKLQRSAVLAVGAYYVVGDTVGDADFDFESDFHFGTG